MEHFVNRFIIEPKEGPRHFINLHQANLWTNILLMLCFVTIIGLSQDLDKQDVLRTQGLKEFSIKRADGSDIVFYHSTLGLENNQKKPLWIHLQGSGCNALFSIKKDNEKISIISSFQTDFQKIIEKEYYFVLVEKRGVKFLQDIDADISEYHTYATKENRAKDVVEVINYLIKQPWIDPKKIVVYGFSEGADVAARVSILDKNVTHLGFCSGGVLSQMYDAIIMERRKGVDLKTDHKEIQENVQHYVDVYKDIINNPTSLKKWHGHAYRRWASFFNPPIEDLLRLDIPIFAAMGTKDMNSPIESFDILPLEFIRHGKKNLTWREYPNLDHGFGEIVIENNKEILKDRSSDVLNEFIEWINKNQDYVK